MVLIAKDALHLTENGRNVLRQQGKWRANVQEVLGGAPCSYGPTRQSERSGRSEVIGLDSELL